MTGYIRNDTTNNIANGNVINASDLDGEFDAVQSAFDASTGHNHDGTVGGGAPIAALGPAQDVVITTSVMRPKTDNTVDLGTSTLEFKDLYLDGTAKVDTLTVDESATITANLTVNGNTTLGNAATDTVTVTADVASHLIPATDNTYDLGGASDEWRNLYIDGTAQVDTLQVDESATITADLTVNGNTTLGNATTDTLTLTAQLATSVLPSTDNAVDLGSSSKEWRDLYVDGTANIDTLVADTATISAGTATLSAGTIITSTGGVLTLQRDDTAITTGETLGEIDFQAPNVSGGGDAIVVAATIRAVARDTFDAAVNKTSLLFETANSGVVATRMEIDGTGNVAVDTNTLYVDAVNNRVGVGTIAPVEKLDVASGLARFANDITPATEGDGAAYFGKIGGQAFVSSISGFAVRDNGATRLTVDTTGNVGIGTSSPQRALHIAAAEPAIILQETDQATDESRWRVYMESSDLLITTANDAFNAAQTAYRIARGDGIAVDTHQWQTAGSERMRINSAGLVGIGTASPAAQLHVAGITNNTAQFTASISGTTMDVTAVASGTLNVGNSVYAGPVSPITKITALGTGTGGTGTYTVSVSQTVASSTMFTGSGTAATIRISDTDTGAQGGQPQGTIEFFGSDISTPGAGVGAYIAAVTEDGTPDTALTFGTRDDAVAGVDANERMRITSDGLVGIGTSSPGARLDIGGGGNALLSGAATGDQIIRIGSGRSGSGNSYLDLVGDTTYTSYGTRLIRGNTGANANSSLNHRGTGVLSLNAVDAGAINFSTNNTERMRIDASGNLGLGVTPSAWATLVPAIQIGGGGSFIAAQGSGTANSDSIYIGTNAHFDGTNWLYKETNNASYSLQANGVHQWFTAPSGTAGNTITFTERARITNTGILLVGKSASDISTAGWELSPSGGGSLAGTISSGTNEIFTFNNTSTTGTAQVDFRTANVEKGSISWNNTNTAFNTTSDYRLKENVAPMQNALDTVSQLNPVTYTWKADGSAGQGFIAHELQAVVPDCVTGEKDAVDETGNPQYQGVDTSFLVATLVKAIQELKAEVDSLRAQLNP